MGERPVDQADEETRARRRRELGAAAAAKREELRASAAAKREELGASAAAKREELRATAAAKGGELRTSAAGLGRSAAQRSVEVRQRVRKLDVPWARCAPARFARETILQFGLGPLMDLYVRSRVRGRDVFDDVPPPVIFVANHSSHLDTPTILRALPLQWRQRTAVGAAADYFYNKRAVAHAVALVFNTVPILRRENGAAGASLDVVHRLIEQRWNLLLYPEGTRSRDGRLKRLRSGAALLAQEHDIPIIPVHVTGTHDAMPPGRNWPKRVHGFFSRRHRVEVSFGEPVWPRDGEDGHGVMDRVRTQLEDQRESPSRFTRRTEVSRISPAA